MKPSTSTAGRKPEMIKHTTRYFLVRTSLRNISQARPINKRRHKRTQPSDSPSLPVPRNCKRRKGGLTPHQTPSRLHENRSEKKLSETLPPLTNPTRKTHNRPQALFDSTTGDTASCPSQPAPSPFSAESATGATI